MLQGPSFYWGGAFFPSWMLCLAAALIIVLVVRLIFIRIGLEDMLTFRLLTYTAMVVAFAYAFALIIYGR